MAREDAPHILFIEDNEATRYAVNRVLRGAGYRVTIAEGGAKGLALARELRPDLVLSDVALPDLSGLEVCRALKGDPNTSDIPVIFLSASHVASEDKVQGLDFGADAYLTHPVSAHELVATLRALLRVRLAEARNRRLVSSNLVGVGEFTTTGVYLEANDELCRILGVTRAEVRAGAVRCDERTVPEHRERDLAALEELRTKGSTGPFEKDTQRPDGVRVPVLCAGALVEGRTDLAIGFVLDITERRRAEDERAEALQRAESAQRRMSLLLAVSSALVGEPGRLAHALRRVAELSVPAVGDWVLVDRVLSDGTVHRVAVAAGPERAEDARAVAQDPPASGAGAIGRALATGEPQLVDAVEDPAELAGAHPGRHGEALRALGVGAVLALPLVARGRVLGVATFVRSDPRRPISPLDAALAEEIAGRAALALENARLHEELERALRAREEVLAEVSHDLRTPISSVMIGVKNLELSGADSWDPGTRQKLQVVRRAGERMWRLVADLLDLARIQAGRFTIEANRHAARALVYEAVEAHAGIAREKGVNLDPQPAEAVDVSCDRERVQQVFANLLGNAIKFAPAASRVEVGARARDGEALLWVKDEGPGIPPEDLPHVFDRYWRTRHGGQGGAGLGLSIAKGIVEAHGGRIWAESAPGRGATFLFTLPRVRG